MKLLREGTIFLFSLNYVFRDQKVGGTISLGIGYSKDELSGGFHR